jgi:hypothetical protein
MTESPAVDELLDRIGQALRERGETLESMLAVLREERARVFAERYPKASDKDVDDEETE